MSSSHQFVIMSLHAGQKDYHEVCTNYLSHSAISSIDCGKGSRLEYDRKLANIEYHSVICAHLLPILANTHVLRNDVIDSAPSGTFYKHIFKFCSGHLLTR